VNIPDQNPSLRYWFLAANHRKDRSRTLGRTCRVRRRVFDATASITYVGGEKLTQAQRLDFGVIFNLGHK